MKISKNTTSSEKNTISSNSKLTKLWYLHVGCVNITLLASNSDTLPKHYHMYCLIGVWGQVSAYK